MTSTNIIDGHMSIIYDHMSIICDHTSIIVGQPQKMDNPHCPPLGLLENSARFEDSGLEAKGSKLKKEGLPSKEPLLDMLSYVAITKLSMFSEHSVLILCPPSTLTLAQTLFRLTLTLCSDLSDKAVTCGKVWLPEVGLSLVKAWGHPRKGLLDSC